MIAEHEALYSFQSRMQWGKGAHFQHFHSFLRHVYAPHRYCLSGIVVAAFDLVGYSGMLS